MSSDTTKTSADDRVSPWPFQISAKIVAVPLWLAAWGLGLLAATLLVDVASLYLAMSSIKKFDDLRDAVLSTK